MLPLKKSVDNLFVLQITAARDLQTVHISMLSLIANESNSHPVPIRNILRGSNVALLHRVQHGQQLHKSLLSPSWGSAGSLCHFQTEKKRYVFSYDYFLHFLSMITYEAGPHLPPLTARRDWGVKMKEEQDYGTTRYYSIAW